MSILKKQMSLSVSFKAFVSENPKEKQNNIVCIPSYRKFSKTQEFDPLLLSNPQNQLLIPVVNYSSDDQIQFIFRRLSTSELLGSISLTTDLFAAFNQKEFSQWLTLFDDLEDDIFDGVLGEDDEDAPRAYLYFRISKVEKQEKKEEPFPNILPSNLDNDHDKNVSFVNDEEDSEAGSSDLEDEKVDDEEIDDGKYKLEAKIDTEDLVKELRERLHSISSPEDLLKVTQEIDVKRGNYESDIMKKIFKNRDMVDEEGKPIDDSKRIIELEQEVSMYRLENEKTSKIETNTKEVKQLNSRMEKQYDELLNKYKSCIESNEKECKQVVNENNGLRTEMTTLQKEVSRLNNQITELKKQQLEPKYQIELDKLKVEKSKLKSQNFKKLADDLTNQKNMMTQALTQEKEENSKLKQKIEEINTLYKTNIEQTQELEDEYEERTKQHANDINTLNENLTESHNKILELENANQEMKQELSLTRDENEKLKNENKNLLDNLRNLNKELKEAKIAKFEEVSQLTNKINENQLEFDRLNNEVQHLKRELEFNNIQLKKMQDFDYPNQIRQKENMLHESEKQRNKLQDDLTVVHKQYKQNLEEMTKKIIENNEAMNNISIEGENDSCSRQITVATLREIEERYKEQLLEKEKKINDLVYIVKTYKISEQMLAERDKIIEELRKQIAELKETIRKLQEERDRLQNEIFRLTEELIKQSKTNLDQLNTINKICEDNKRLQQNLDSAIECIPLRRESSKYVPTKGDKIDKRLSVFINKSKNLPIQFIRIGEGLYTFGTKKIAVKILNGKIVIRVGGGYLMIEEFLRLYTFSELKKLSEIAKTGKNPVPEAKKDIKEKEKENKEKEKEKENKEKEKEKEKDEASDSDSDSSGSSEPETENIKPQIGSNKDIIKAKLEENNHNTTKGTMLSPRDGTTGIPSSDSKKKSGKKVKKNVGDKKTTTNKTPVKRFTLFKPEEQDSGTKKKGNDVTLEVTKGGNAVKYEKHSSTSEPKNTVQGAQFHSPKNFQSPPPAKRNLGKK